MSAREPILAAPLAWSLEQEKYSILSSRIAEFGLSRCRVTHRNEQLLKRKVRTSLKIGKLSSTMESMFSVTSGFILRVGHML